jgi:hypothetical protein
MSPFEAMYERPPSHLGLSVPNVPKAPGLEDWLKEWKAVTALKAAFESCILTNEVPN